MKRLCVVQQQDRWLAFDGNQVRITEAKPKLDRQAVVISDFEGAISNVISLEGSPAHAVALIDKRLRSDGLTDGESKILVHKTRTIGAGYQTLFTAIPLDLWQQVYAWTEAQRDHCLLVPVTSLLWHAIGTGKGVILHAGSQVSALAALKRGIVYRSALAYSDSPEDLAMTVGALATQFAEDLESSEDDADGLQMAWCSVLATKQADGAGWTDDVLREQFSERSGLKVTSVPTGPVRDEAGVEYRSGIGWLASATSPFIAVNRNLSRLAYVAERALPLASAVSLLFALILAALSGRWELSASDANAKAGAIAQEIERIDSTIAGLQARQQIPAGFDETLSFVERAGGLHAAIDPAGSLRLVRDAAKGNVRILRLRVQQPAADSNVRRSVAAAAPVARVEPVLRVDGTVDAGRGQGGMQVARFIDRLREQGFDPVPADPQGGNLNAGTGSGYFSYLLKRPVLVTKVAAAGVAP